MTNQHMNSFLKHLRSDCMFKVYGSDWSENYLQFQTTQSARKQTTIQNVSAVTQTCSSKLPKQEFNQLYAMDSRTIRKL